MLLFVVIPVILLVGCAGNLVSLYIFTRPSLNGLSTFRFLAYLSLVDLLYLLVGLPHIIIMIFFDSYDIRDSSNLACSIHSFLTYYLSHLSSNVLAAVGIFRCLTITRLRPPTKAAIKSRNHHKKNNKPKSKPVVFKNENNSECYSMAAECRLMTKTNAGVNSSPTHYSQSNGQNDSLHNVSLSGSIKPVFRMSFGRADAFILAIMLIVFLVDSHFLLFMRLQPVEFENTENNSSLLTTNDTPILYRCYPTSSLQPVYYDFYVTIYPWIDMILYSYIPFGIMMICTILIIYRLLSINRRLSKSSKMSKMKKESAATTTASAKTTRSTQTDKKGGAKGSTVVSVTKHDGEEESMVERSLDQMTDGVSSRVPSTIVQPPIILVNNNYYIEASSDSGPTLSNESELTESKQQQTSSGTHFALKKYIVNIKSTGRQHESNGKKSDTSSRTDPMKKRARKNSQIYKLLLTLNVVFFVLVTPLVLCNSLGWLDNQNITTQLVYILAYLNHCINFLFYGLSCEMYRQSLLELVPSCLNKIK